jgi:hypothetical protein
VRVIEEVLPAKLHNNVAGQILNAQIVVNETTYEGAGQVIVVADAGSTVDTHPAFTGRVARLYSLGRPSTGKTDDPNGHGTHVCGSALGDGTSASMGGAIRGTAPKATLVVQSLIDPTGTLGGIPTDLTDLFLPPYHDDGARVHTNSWGTHDPCPPHDLPYGQPASEIDDFVWNHQDLVICFAAGNEGTDRNRDGIVDPAQIWTQAAAKNCITVGACESNRPNIELTYGRAHPFDFPKPPIYDDPIANNPEGMVAFSSRGPTLEGRFKPDVVAPGTSILSTHSRHAPPRPQARPPTPITSSFRARACLRRLSLAARRSCARHSSSRGSRRPVPRSSRGSRSNWTKINVKEITSMSGEEGDGWNRADLSIPR